MLLNRPIAKVVTPFNRELDGHFVETNIDHVIAHLNGEIALTFSVLEGHRASGFACFIGWDIDVYAPHRIGVMKRVLHEIDPTLVDACFATDGSAPDKGKVILTLEEPVPAQLAHRFAREIRRRCLQQSDFGHVSAADFEERPRSGAGGLLRIGGRNILKDATELESFLDLDGAPNDLMSVVPIARELLDAMTFELTQYGSVPLTWLNNHLHTPWRYDLVTPPNTRGIIRRIAAVARAFAEKHGAAGEARFRAYIATVAANSPALDGPSPKNRDTSNPLRNESYLAATWKHALEEPVTWTPHSLEGSGVPEREINCYNALVNYRGQRRFSPYIFAMDYGRIGEMIGLDKVQARRVVLRLEKRGLLVRHHPGRAITHAEHGGLPGLSTIMGLVGVDETPEMVRSFATSDAHAKATLSKRATAMLTPARGRPASRRVAAAG